MGERAINTSDMSELSTPLQDDIAGANNCFVAVNCLLISSGKLTGKQYTITGVEHADTLRHKRDLCTLIDRSLR